MMPPRNFIVAAVWLLVWDRGIAQSTTYDLAITDVKVFDAKTKRVNAHQTILIGADTIAFVGKTVHTINALKTIEGRNRLVVPGFIDTHTHLRNVYGTLEQVGNDSGRLDRQKLTDTYLKYGVTTIVDMGMPEKWMNTVLDWQRSPSAAYPTIFVSGGAMVSPEPGRKTYMNHVVVDGPTAVQTKVSQYADSGIKHIKVYWRLRKPELEAVIREAKKRQLTLSAHLGQNVTSISEAIDLGVTNFEHMLSLPPQILLLNNHYRLLKQKYGFTSTEHVDQLLASILFYFDYIRQNPEWDAQLKALLIKMAAHHVSFSTSIHIMGAVAEKTYFFTSLSSQDTLTLPRYTSVQKAKLALSFDVMMRYLKYAHDHGVSIRIGTDCRHGGKAMLSELMLLYEAGFPTADILQIATLNGARAMHIDDNYGTIEKGKKADLILFEQSPFDNYKNFLATKIVLKGGQILMN